MRARSLPGTPAPAPHARIPKADALLQAARENKERKKIRSGKQNKERESGRLRATGVAQNKNKERKEIRSGEQNKSTTPRCARSWGARPDSVAAFFLGDAGLRDPAREPGLWRGGSCVLGCARQSCSDMAGIQFNSNSGRPPWPRPPCGGGMGAPPPHPHHHHLHFSLEPGRLLAGKPAQKGGRARVEK